MFGYFFRASKARLIVVLLAICSGATCFYYCNKAKPVSGISRSFSKSSKEAPCIFCEIIAQRAPATIIKNGKTLLVFRDIAPRAKTHFLIIPKKHICNMKDVDPKLDGPFWQELLVTIQELGAKLTDEQAFALENHNGARAKQTVFHLHWHFLSDNYFDKK